MKEKPKRFIRLEEVMDKLSVKKSSVWEWTRTGYFPLSIRIGEKRTVWLESEVDAWMDMHAKENRSKLGEKPPSLRKEKVE